MSNKLIVSGADEYFTHQIALPHQVIGTSDSNWRERYWVSVHDIVSKDWVLSFGYGKYPNRDVMEAFVIAAKGDVQQNLRLSRQLMPRAHDIAVGPMRTEIIEPLQKLRFILDENPSGTAFDLVWDSSVEPALEGRHFEVNRARVTHDIARYVQTGKLTGTITMGGETLNVTADRCWGVRDHSWGIRPMTAVPGDPPVASVEWNFLAFCPIQFPTFSIHLYLFESLPGRPTHLTASIMRPAGDDAHDDEIKAVTHDFTWDDDAAIQTLTGGWLRLELFSGETLEIEVFGCKGRAYLAGGGYGTHHGKWQGENFLEHDTFDLTDATKLRTYNSHSSDHLIEARCGDQHGFGVIEYMVRKGYGKYPRPNRK